MTEPNVLALSVRAGDAAAGNRNMAMIVSADGAIADILQGQDLSISPPTIDTVWPGEISARIRDSLRRVLRSRQFVAEEIDQSDGNRRLEFIYVAQGRNRVLLVVRDVSREHLALSRMRELAFVDDATALPNREYLLERLGSILDHQRLREGRAAVICCHVEEAEEHRRAFGDGHQDTLLRELGERLVAEIRGANDRSSDDLERQSVVARIDFRQFGIVLPSIEIGTDAESVAERLTETLQRPVTTGNRSVNVRASAGIALFPQDGHDAAALLDNARAAMEDACNDHGSRIRFHSGTVKLRTLQRQDLAAEIRGALARQDFSLKYLPIVDAATGSVQSVEALLRWPDSMLGLQSTRKLVALAERTGLILPIGDWVLDQACRDVCHWRSLGHDRLRLSVNLSMQEFAQPDLADRIAERLAATGLSPADLDVEINEQMLRRDAGCGYEVCRALVRLGAGIIVDDYGVGSCSLTHLAHSPASAIKIDNTLVAQLGFNDRDDAACAAAVQIGEALEIRTIAEGVETRRQAERLVAAGVDLLQGFLLSAPLSADEVPDCLARKTLGRDAGATTDE